MSEPVHLECCVCGGYAGSWEQHWNRDEGYGICPTCVAEEAARNTAERMLSLYGKVGVNYDQPVVRHLGRKYKVLAATKDQGVANEFMTNNPGASVLKVFDDGTIALVDKDDVGEPM